MRPGGGKPQTKEGKGAPLAFLPAPEPTQLVVLYLSPLYKNKIKRDRQNKASLSLTKAPPLSKLGALST